MVEYIGSILFSKHLQHVDTVCMQLLYLLQVFVEQLQGVAQAAVITEFACGYENSTELQTAAESDLTLNVKMLVIGIKAGAFLI